MWMLGVVIMILMGFAIYGGYVAQMEKYKLFRRYKAMKNMENHCVTDKD